MKVNIEYCIDNIVNKFLKELKLKGKILQNNSLFKVSEKSLTLDEKRANAFHSFAIKKIFLVKKARLSLESYFVFLSIRPKYLIEED